MDLSPEPSNSQDNVEDCKMNGAKENVSCTCDCGGSSSKCAYMTADDITNQTFETSDATYNLYVSYARCVGFGFTEVVRESSFKKMVQDAKKYSDETLVGSTVQDMERAFLMRYGALLVAKAWMVFLGAQNGPSFHDTINEVYHLTNALEQKSGLKKQATKSLAQNLVDDPLVVKTKGAPKGRKERGKRKCTECNNAGHSKRNCRARNDKNIPGEGDGSGLQAGSDMTKDNPKEPMDPQETSVIPSAKVDESSTKEGIDLSSSELNNSEEVPKPSIGSHRWLLQVMQQGQYPSFGGTQ
ncbi:hypothetical protein PIB30_118025 [Stylosanthes scabra]|uniref:CCHC-type domain-containing protein n=1 Tax=Stylosanthes scabra TaxID=79078 RepID=A0ABU6R716_9FABA|nr:hypothetical protein [Stylosanthes scabra]